MSNALYTAEQLRQIEARYNQTHGEFYLMQKAGQASADYIESNFPELRPRRLLILAGPGNNGGDALVTASLLIQRGYAIDLVCCQPDIQRWPTYRGAAAQAWQVWQSRSASCTSLYRQFCLADFLAETNTAQPTYGLIIDGLFGLGLQRPLQGGLAKIVAFCNQLSQRQGLPVLALDIPSGIQSDTGALPGSAAGAEAIRATHTLSFLSDKPGLHTAAALDYVGQVALANLGVNADELPSPDYHLLDHHYPFSLPAPRLLNSHKGLFGDVYLLGGAAGMQGALILAARAARMLGTGRLFLGFLDQAPAFDPAYPELMCRQAESLDLHQACVVLGPGLGQSAAAVQLCARALRQARLVIVDADALNCLAAEPELQKIWQTHPQQIRLLTPHPLEAARLLGCSSQQVQDQRFSALNQLLERYQASVILKGAGSLVAAPGSSCFINRSGNPLLAAGGTGDILSGLCGAFAAQGLAILEAAQLACYLHGAAADLLATQHPGWLAASSEEIIRACREVYAQMQLNQAARPDANWQSETS